MLLSLPNCHSKTVISYQKNPIRISCSGRNSISFLISEILMTRANQDSPVFQWSHTWWSSRGSQARIRWIFTLPCSRLTPKPNRSSSILMNPRSRKKSRFFTTLTSFLTQNTSSTQDSTFLGEKSTQARLSFSKMTNCIQDTRLLIFGTLKLSKGHSKVIQISCLRFHDRHCSVPLKARQSSHYSSKRFGCTSISQSNSKRLTSK